MKNTTDHKASIFGFWLYLMSDCLLFASLFATFAVLRGNTFGGPNAEELLNVPFVLAETLVLLTSSFTAGVALIAAQLNKRAWVFGALAATFILGATFLGLELHEFAGLIAAGDGPGRSAFLSAFFALVGTHGLHVAAGLLWMLILSAQMLSRPDFEAAPGNVRTKLLALGLFWHFLDVVWIGIFSLVYLLGATL